jgi:hypothetical protein
MQGLQVDPPYALNLVVCDFGVEHDDLLPEVPTAFLEFLAIPRFQLSRHYPLLTLCS